VVLTACWVTLRGCLGDAKSSLGDANSLLGDAKSSRGDAKSSRGDAKSSRGDAKSSRGDAKTASYNFQLGLETEPLKLRFLSSVLSVLQLRAQSPSKNAVLALTVRAKICRENGTISVKNRHLTVSKPNWKL
jgi:hypothetical protein